MIFEYDENNLDKFENFKGGEKYIEAKMYFRIILLILMFPFNF